MHTDYLLWNKHCLPIQPMNCHLRGSFLNPRETAPIPGSPPKDTDATGYTVNVFAIIIFITFLIRR